MADAPLRRGRPPLSPTTRAKRRRESRLKIHDTRITIGNTFDDWMAIKDERGFTKHEEVARCLINTYRKYHEMCKEKSLQSSRESTSDLFITTVEDDDICSETVLSIDSEHLTDNCLHLRNSLSSTTSSVLAEHFPDTLSDPVVSHFERTSYK